MTREKAIQTVLGVMNEPSRSSSSSLIHDLAERIVDALLGQPDPEVERLREVEEAARELLSALSRYVGLAVPLKGEEELFNAAEERVYRDSTALRAALSKERKEEDR